MKRKTVSGIMLSLLLIGMLTLTFDTKRAEALEPPPTEWTRTYGGVSPDMAHSVVETSDGGYALAGYTTSFGAGSNDFWLVKVDSSGNMEWNKTYGGADDDRAQSVVETGDGGYAIAGYSNSFGAGGYDFWLIKTDASGNKQWDKTYGGTNYDWGLSVIQTSDGGYALTGETRSFGAGLSDSLLVKTDENGNMEWHKTYGGTNQDIARSVVETGDGGYALAGSTNSFGAGWVDFWLVKVDSSGNMEWNKTYGGARYDYAYSVVETSDGGYALAGKTTSFGAGDSDCWLVKVDSSGNHEWNKTYGGTGFDEAYSVVETGDGGYALAGSTTSFGAGYSDFWLVKVAPPYYQLTVTSSPITGVTFAVNGTPQTTPYTEWLPEDSYILEMPATHNGYVWSHWLEDGDPNRIKTITLQGTTWTAVYEPAPPPPVGGKATPINIPMNKPETLTLWIWLTTIILSLVLAGVYVKKRKKNTRTLPYVKC